MIENLEINIQHAPGLKCPRCWKYTINAHYPTDLCQRCLNVLKENYPDKLNEAIKKGLVDCSKKEHYFWYKNWKEIK